MAHLLNDEMVKQKKQASNKLVQRISRTQMSPEHSRNLVKYKQMNFLA